MKFNNASLRAITHYTSENILSSEAIEDRLGQIYNDLKLPFGRLEMMTGIKERGIWPIGTNPSSLSINAAQKIFSQNKDLNREDIDLIINCSVCRDFLEPATASVVHAGLGLSSKCSFFDLSNACLGIVQAMSLASSLIEAGAAKNVLLTSGENSGPLLEATIDTLLEMHSKSELTRKNIKSYIANLTIGSAATALVISHKDLAPNAPRILGSASLTDSSANELCRGDGNSHSLMMQTDSEALMKKGIALAISNFNLIKEQQNLNNKDIDLVLTHQVGSAHEAQTLESLDLKECNTHRTYPHFGNTGSSALALTLSKAIEQKHHALKKDALVCLMGIGSGLASTMLTLRWNKLC